MRAKCAQCGSIVPVPAPVATVHSNQTSWCRPPFTVSQVGGVRQGGRVVKAFRHARTKIYRYLVQWPDKSKSWHFRFHLTSSQEQ